MNGDEETSRASALLPPPPPSRVSLAPFRTPLLFRSPCCRLSGRLCEPVRLAPSRRQLAWISLQGRLVGAEEATASGVIRGGLSGEETVAWEFFSPLHRVLLVAVVAVAASNSEKARKIAELQKSVSLRDEVLRSMQLKLEDLYEKMNSLHDQPSQSSNILPFNNDQFASEKKLEHGVALGKLANLFEKTNPVHDQPSQSSSLLPFGNDQFVAEKKLKHGVAQGFVYGSLLPELNPESGITPFLSNTANKAKDIDGTESVKEEAFSAPSAIVGEQEERRMSELSDFNWSVTSSVDFQLSTLASEQEFYNLRKECEEKDAMLKELAAAVHESRTADSKRIKELEEIIRRKNMVKSKLKKDMAVLERQVVELTRLGRASSSSAASDLSSMQLPVMANNVLYDMSSISPSSSDPDSPVASKKHLPRGPLCNNTSLQSDVASSESKRKPLSKPLISLNRSLNRPQKQQSVSPFKENRRVQRTEPTAALRHRQAIFSSGDHKRTRKGAREEVKNTNPLRWT